MIIPHSILEEFLSQKFSSLSSIRVDDYSFLGEGDSKFIHIVFSAKVIGIDWNLNLKYQDQHFGEDILLSDFMIWLGERRSGRLEIGRAHV